MFCIALSFCCWSISHLSLSYHLGVTPRCASQLTCDRRLSCRLNTHCVHPWQKFWMSLFLHCTFFSPFFLGNVSFLLCIWFLSTKRSQRCSSLSCHLHCRARLSFFIHSKSDFCFIHSADRFDNGKIGRASFTTFQSDCFCVLHVYLFFLILLNLIKPDIWPTFFSIWIFSIDRAAASRTYTETASYENIMVMHTHTHGLVFW